VRENSVLGPKDGRYFVRSAFISDVHLGTRDCRADLLLEFLERVHADELWLVGDIVDLWSLRRAIYWPALHAQVLRAIVAASRRGTRVRFVPGNHDEELRDFSGSELAGIEVLRRAEHVTAQGQRLLVLHGDEFDGAVQCGGLLSSVGSQVYDWTLEVNRHFNALRGLLGYPYWSLAGYLKGKVGNAMQYVERFEQAAANAARREGYDGVICGHIHRAAMRDVSGVLYCNDGDWVESCSALIEDRNGRLAVWHWSEMRGVLHQPNRLTGKRAAA
jgi:UDP-2,3-diacylglucosamine pyrophosphatase LpxH